MKRDKENQEQLKNTLIEVTKVFLDGVEEIHASSQNLTSTSPAELAHAASTPNWGSQVVTDTTTQARQLTTLQSREQQLSNVLGQQSLGQNFSGVEQQRNEIPAGYVQQNALHPYSSAGAYPVQQHQNVAPYEHAHGLIYRGQAHQQSQNYHYYPDHGSYN